MTDEFTTSESTDKLDAALAKAQGKISAAAKDKVNPHFKSKYADLASVWEACRTALAENGVSVTQWPVHSEDGRVHLVTRLAHAGQWMRGHFSVPAQKPDAQGYGSAITYLKRFSLSAAVGVVADDDDDGNAASRNGNGAREDTPQQQHRQPTPPPPAKTNGNGATHTNGAHQPGNIPSESRSEAASIWVDQSIPKLKACRSKEDVKEWWKANAQTITKAERDNPQAYDRLLVAYDDAFDSKPSLRMAG